MTLAYALMAYPGATVWAQTAANLEGRITDETGAALPETSVTVSNA